jgi:putative Mg2+ transporter-C (MgtC) family protein
MALVFSGDWPETGGPMPFETGDSMPVLPFQETLNLLYQTALRPEYVIYFDMAVALFLGVVFGYERSYHGRAAGMRTYALVCMVGAALTALSGHPEQWFSGHAMNLGPIDPTRTIQGIVTGVGFLGAGIIMKDGLKISGLTTAASIWSAASIGVLVGAELYLPAIALTLLSTLAVMLGSRFATYLPSRRPVFVVVQFKKDYLPSEDDVREITLEHGYEIASGSIAINYRGGQVEWRFVATSQGGHKAMPITELAETLPTLKGIESFQLSRARN